MSASEFGIFLIPDADHPELTIQRAGDGEQLGT